MGCEEAMPSSGGTVGLSPPEWLHGEWTTEGADTTHSQWPLRVEITSGNVVVIGPSLGADYAELGKNDGISISDSNPGSGHFTGSP